MKTETVRRIIMIVIIAASPSKRTGNAGKYPTAEKILD